MLLTAQVKIATIDIQAIFNDMPEAREAQATLDGRNAYYQREYNALQEDFNEKYATYQRLNTDPATPPSILERRMREIQIDNTKIDDFLKQSKAEMAQLKSELEQPIYERINAAISEVATSLGLTYVLDISTTPVVYSGADAIDITADVKRHLGLNDKK